MTKHSFRSLVVAATIGSFSIAALLGVIALLGGGSFGEGETRILLTTVLIGSGSIAMLCCLATDETPYRWVGVLGGLLVLVPVVTGLLMIWQSWADDDSWNLLQTFGVGTTLGITVAQICLLLGLAHDRTSLRPLLWGTVLLALVLGGTVSAMIIGETGSDATGRFVGVVAILDVLGTVVTIALARFGAAAATGRATGQTVAVALPAALAGRLDQHSAHTGVSRDALVVEAVDQFLARAGSSA
jgi:F0F1-type ATP synthase assembly protein I